MRVPAWCQPSLHPHPCPLRGWPHFMRQRRLPPAPGGPRKSPDFPPHHLFLLVRARCRPSTGCDPRSHQTRSCTPQTSAISLGFPWLARTPPAPRPFRGPKVGLRKASTGRQRPLAVRVQNQQGPVCTTPGCSRSGAQRSPIPGASLSHGPHLPTALHNGPRQTYTLCFSSALGTAKPGHSCISACKPASLSAALFLEAVPTLPPPIPLHQSLRNHAGKRHMTFSISHS